MGIELGRVGAVLNPGAGSGFLDAAVAADELGYGTVWLTGGSLTGLHQVADVVRATRRVRVGTSIIAVDTFAAEDVAARYRDLAADHPGRFVVGLGGAHGADPRGTLNRYLDRLDELGVPADARVLAALGPRMLDLARERTAGALPVLVTPEYTADTRARLGHGVALVVEQLVVVEPDAARARTAARGPLGFLGRLPAYQANFRRMGFSDEEISGQADRLVDALVPWGDADAVAAHVAAQLHAGADHVAVYPVTAGPDVQPTEELRLLAARLLAG
jgi:probable F420-dependent oxidoreductase